MSKITEQESSYQKLEHMSIEELLSSINREDHRVAEAVQKALPQLTALTSVVVDKLQAGGRLFYIGAGTSGRLGVLDASECPPTFGVPHGLVIGIIAGGDSAIRKAVEFAEDDEHQAWEDLKQYDIGVKDVVVGLAASGSTPYVLGGIRKANESGITTGCVVCNEGSPISLASRLPVEVVVGPEFLTGSTRMKAGTAQKMVLNQLSTAVMIRLGRVKGNKMVDMQLSNHKLIQRGVDMIVAETGVDSEKAKVLLEKLGSVRAVIDQKKKNQ